MDKQVETELCDYPVLIRQTLAALVAGGEADKTTVLQPRPEGRWERLPGFFFHVGYEIFIQIDGGCRFRFPREEMVLRPGSILIVPPGMPHQERSFSLQGRKFRNLLIVLNSGYVAVHIAESRGIGEKGGTPEPVYPERFGSGSGQVYMDMAAAAENAAAGEAGALLRLRLLQAMAAMILDAIGDVPPPGGETGAAREHFRITMVKAIINHTILAESPSVAELAARVGCSPNYLSWLFRRETGLTLKEYINRARMDHARSLLRTTTRSIGEVAWMCGFRDAAYFSRLFERCCGAKPHEWRRRVSPSG